MRIPDGLKPYLWKNRILFGALAVLILILIVDGLFFKPRTTRKDRLLSFEMSEIRSFTVLNKSGRFEFVRNGEDWILAGVPEVRPGKREIDSFLDECRNLRFRRRLDAAADADLRAFGLDATNTLIRIETSEDVLDLVLGAGLPGGGGYYAGSSGRVYVMAPASSGIFEKTLFTFRDKRVIPAQAAYVRKIRLDFRGRTVRLEKKEREWMRISPGRGPIAADQVNTLLLGIESFEASGFVSGQDLNLTHFGFPATSAVELGLADGSTVRLGLGRVDRQGLAVGREPAPKELAWTDPYLLTAVSNYVHLFSISPGPDASGAANAQGANDEAQ